jgi:hypothetical protein
MFHELLSRDREDGSGCRPPRPPCEQGEAGGPLDRRMRIADCGEAQGAGRKAQGKSLKPLKPFKS